MRLTHLIIGFLFLINDLHSQITAPLNVNLPKTVIGAGLAAAETASTFKWFPAKNAKEAAEIWSNGERWNFLNMASISGTNNGGTASVDIVSDFLGPMRFALVGNVSAASDGTTNEQKVERFLSGGGSAALIGNLLGPTFSWGKASYILTSFVPKVGFDFPALGNTTDGSTANADLGIEIKANLPLENNKLGFFGNFRSSYTMAGDKFYEQIGSVDKKPFGYSILNAGITLPNLRMAVLFTRVLGGPSFIESYNGDGRISLVISPK